MKIPNHKLHSTEYDNLSAGKEFIFNDERFLCNGIDQEYVYCDRMIFENDMPFHRNWEQSFYDKKDEKIRLSRKFKPNGITDNRKEWREKNRIHSAIIKMVGISKEVGFKSVEITEELKP